MSRKKDRKGQESMDFNFDTDGGNCCHCFAFAHLCHWNHLCEGFIHGAKLPPWRFFGD